MLISCSILDLISLSELSVFFQNMGSQTQLPIKSIYTAGKRKGRGQGGAMGTDRDGDEESAVTHRDRKSVCSVSVLEVWCL